MSKFKHWGMIAALFTTSAFAQNATNENRIILWKDLAVGQPISSVLGVLRTYPEIKSVKAKRVRSGRAPELDIDMAKDGIPVFGIEFGVEPAFDLDGRLTTVTLSSGPECANQAVEKSADLISTLEQKYGPDLRGQEPPDRLDVLSALNDSYRAERSMARTYFFADDQVAVILAMGFNHTPPPRPTYGSALANSLSDLARSIYDTAGTACENTGHERVAYIVQYMSRAAFDAQLQDTARDITAEREEAADNL